MACGDQQRDILTLIFCLQINDGCAHSAISAPSDCHQKDSPCFVAAVQEHLLTGGSNAVFDVGQATANSQAFQGNTSRPRGSHDHADRASSDDGRSFDDPETPLPEQGKNAAITTIPWTLVLSNRIHLSAWSQCLAAHCWQSSAASSQTRAPLAQQLAKQMK